MIDLSLAMTDRVTPIPVGIPRLKKRPEFLKVAATRKKWVAAGLILQVRRHRDSESGLATSRVGFTVSRKVGNAVRRNRVRRRLRAAADLIMGEHVSSGHDFVIIGRQGTIKRSFPDILSDLETALKKMGAYR